MTDLVTIEQEVSPLVAKAEALTIESAEDMKASAELLSQCNKYLDAVTEDKEKLTKPLNESLKGIRAKYKPTTDILEAAIFALRKEQSRYQTEMLRKQREEEAKIAARTGEGKGHYKLETAVRKIDEIEKVEATVSTDAGTVKFREVKKFRVTDISKIPFEYLIPNESLIREAMKNGTEIIGIEYYTEQQPVNFR